MNGDAQDDTTFAFICCLDDGDDPLTDPSCWKKANPLLGVILEHDYLEDVVKQAIAIPGKRNNILRLHFCIWTDSDQAWIGREVWQKLEDPDMRMEDFAGQDCYIGLDLSATRDLTGLSIVFKDGIVRDKQGNPVLNSSGEEQPKYALFARGYTPQDTLHERAETDKAPYDLWADSGFLIATPGKVIRYDMIVADLIRMKEQFNIVAICYDQWLIRTFEEAMEEAGLYLPLVEHPQGTNRRPNTDLWMPGSIDEVEALVLEGRLRIEVNPALRSAVASVAMFETAAGLRRFQKNKSTARIDIAVAATMGIGGAAADAMQIDPTAWFG